jgi:hypothetical protein
VNASCNYHLKTKSVKGIISTLVIPGCYLAGVDPHPDPFVRKGYALRDQMRDSLGAQPQGISLLFSKVVYEHFQKT